MKLRDARATPREEALPAGEPDLASDRLGRWLFWSGLAVYAATRFVHLPDFPIFFFTDEAVQANAAHSLYTHHFRDAAGMFLPPYFLNDVRWAMSMPSMRCIAIGNHARSRGANWSAGSAITATSVTARSEPG